MTVKTGTKTVYEQQCSTVYQEKCSGSGYKKTCAPAPTQKCQQVQGRSRNRSNLFIYQAREFILVPAEFLTAQFL